MNSQINFKKFGKKCVVSVTSYVLLTTLTTSHDTFVGLEINAKAT